MAGNLMLLENPYRRRRHARRNPISSATSTFKGWTQGVDAMDIVAAGAGLVSASMIPGMLVKDTTTTSKKLMKLVAALGSAIVVGYALKSAIGPSAGKAAVIGGLAGTATQAIGMFTSFQIGRPSVAGPIRTMHSLGMPATMPSSSNETGIITSVT